MSLPPSRLDLATPGPEGVDEADFVVVGSGAAGATVALCLAEAGADVVVLEEGPHVPVEARAGDVFTTVKRQIRDRLSGGMTGRAISPVIQGSAVGGSTLVNSAIVWRLPEDVAFQWDRLPGLKGAFPYDELVRYMERIEDDLGVGEVPRDRMGRNATLMEAGARALGFAGNVIRRNVQGCQGSGRCLQGCPNAAKLSLDLTYLPRAVGMGARIYENCRVSRLTFAGAACHGVEAELLDPESRRPLRPFRARARRGVIVAASAIQSPNLLRRSGLGRALPRLGDHFTCHPGTGVAGEFDEPVRMWSGATQAWESAHYRPEGFKLEAINLPPELAVVRMPGAGREMMHRLARFDRMALWGFQVRSDARGTVRPMPLLGGDMIRFTPSRRDMGVAARAIKLLGEMMFAAGARKVYLGVHGLPDEVHSPDGLRILDRMELDPRQVHMMASHLFGTCVMSPDRSTGVVDTGFQAHGLPGLYVVDSSVFPTNLGVNPQHSIMAVAMLAARRIAEGARVSR
ncbi:GMC family oxidoreductase [Myxococcota bacterium]|nr:GMC family oxidoreductase [Myxococcota bacterium]